MYRLKQSQIPPHLQKYFRRCGVKKKDDSLVPYRLALSLQASGWYVRSEIIWAKRAPMPESVTDRPTSAHEKIFLLSKAERYYYDADAVREKAVRPGDIQTFGGNKGRNYEPLPGDPNFRNGKEQWGRTVQTGLNGRNLRNVWELSPESFAGAHFAVFPTIIPKRAILAGTSEKGHCPQCGAGWVRTNEMVKSWREDAETKEQSYRAGSGNIRVRSSNGGMSRSVYQETGWQPSCKCGEEDTCPAVVLDPFAGSGTTLAVAISLGRRAIGVELNCDYIAIAEKRIAPFAAQELLPL
jgi:hypothetical protein